MKKLAFFPLLALLLCSCGGEKIDGKPMTIGLRPVKDFYQDFVYQEVSNEYMVAGAGGMSIGLVLFNKFGENTFLMFETRKKLGPIQGNWSVEGRKIVFRSGSAVVAEGEGLQLPGRAAVIDLQLNQFDFLVSSKVSVQKTHLGLDDLSVDAIGPDFLFRNEVNSATGQCFMGEDPSAELSVMVRLYDLEDEDESDPNDGNGKTFELINLKNRNRPVLFANGSWTFAGNKLDLKFLDGQEFGTGEIKSFLDKGRPVLRFRSSPFALASTSKEFNLFLMPKNDCSR